MSRGSRIGTFFEVSGLSLWAVIAALLLGELAFRVVDVRPGPGNTGAVVKREGEVPRRFKAGLGLLNAPDTEFDYTMTADGAVVFKTRQRSNEWGFVAQPVARDLPADAPRIVLLGDSFVEGLEVEMDEKLGAVLEKRISERRGSPAQVVSLAVSGTGQAQQYTWWREFGRRVQPAVVIMVWYKNDIINNFPSVTARLYNGNPLWRQNNYFMLAGDAAHGLVMVPPDPWYLELAPDVFTVHPAVTLGEKPWPQRYSRVADLVWPVLFPSTTVQAQNNRYRDRFSEDSFFYADLRDTDSVVRTGYEISRRILAMIAHDVREAGARLVLVSGWAVPRGSGSGPDFDILDDWLAAQAHTLGAGHVSLPAAMARDGIDTDEITVGYGDPHWTARGHRYAAGLIADFLGENEYLPRPPAR